MRKFLAYLAITPLILFVVALYSLILITKPIVFFVIVGLLIIVTLFMWGVKELVS